MRINCAGSGINAGACFSESKDIAGMEPVRAKRLLVLSIGYGQGHHSAGAAIAEHYSSTGWETRMVDACSEACPFLFRLTQEFYRFCVRRAPWLWGVTYSLTDTADWAGLVRNPFFSPVVRRLSELLQEYQPNLIICTYPLFAYMLDVLRPAVPYVVLVTDAQEISRPWMLSQAKLVTVPDEESLWMVSERYGLDRGMVVAAGFPVLQAFAPSAGRTAPDETCLRVLYGAYRRSGGVVADVAALLQEFPQMKLTVLAGQHEKRLLNRFASHCRSGRLTVLRETTDMPSLLPENHFYIGKAGAATMFECYAANVPAIVNFTLPGQEQGNLQLLLQDGAGCHVESTSHLVQVLRKLLADGAAGWYALCYAMQHANRTRAAENIAAAIERRFGLR